MTQATQNRVMASRILALGTLLAALMAAFVMLAASQAHASTTFYVNSTEDHADALLTGDQCDTGYTVTRDGGGQEAECTLRAAIEQANATSGADTINFAIPGSGVQTIAPQTALPEITGPVSINGYSQPGAHPNTKAVGSDAVLKIEISGARSSGAEGLWITASNSTVKGLVINRWGINAGILISGTGATGNKVVGNYVGTDASGTQKLANWAGVIIFGANNTLGGTTAAERNVVSGSLYKGVWINGLDATGNKVIGNYIGTDSTGTKDLGNDLDGVNITSANNTVGGATAGERNVISGNNSEGIDIYGNDASGNKVAGNYIGTDATGTKGLGNSGGGINISGANNTVGGTTAGERNVISGNNSEGVQISGNDASGNKVTGNYMGTDKHGTADLGNSADGVHIAGAPNNTVGGTTTAERNVISNNAYGVLIDGPNASGNRVLQNLISANQYDGVYVDTATGNRILSNSIFNNGLLGIDLYGDGPTANDPGDKDTGPNNLQNKPVLSSAKKSATGTTTTKATLNSTPGKTFNIQFFSNPTGTNEGKTLLGSRSVTTSGTGNVSFTFSTKKAIRLGQNITATATNTSTGDTSEFSAPRKVVAS
jgi:CSLREA domain-containing protein